MTQKEINKLEERVYAISSSTFPLDAFFNDIEQNKDPDYNKAMAYEDLKLITDEIYRLRELEKTPTLKEVQKEWEDDGYEFCYHPKQCNIINIYLDGNTIIHIWDDKTYDFDSCDGCLPIKLHHRLTKTFKALGWGE